MKKTTTTLDCWAAFERETLFPNLDNDDNPEIEETVLLYRSKPERDMSDPESQTEGDILWHGNGEKVTSSRL